MKKLALIAFAALGLFASGAQAQSQTANIGVSANVVGSCKFTSNGTVAFTLDPSVGGNVNGTISQPVFWCTRGASYNITDDNGLYESGTTHRMRHATDNTEFIPYTFTYTATGTGTGPGTPITLDIAATVASGDYTNALAGNYADTVVLTIAP